MLENCAQSVTRINKGAKAVAQDDNQIKNSDETPSETQQKEIDSKEIPPPPEEIGGPRGLEPTRYGDWERKGRCIDF